MYKSGVSFLLSLVMVMGASASEPGQVVFKGGNVEVSYEDIERYIIENIPEDPAERTAALNDPAIYRKMAESLYTVRVLAGEAASLPDFDREQTEWTAQMMSQRRMTKDYRQKYVEGFLDTVNWEATAKEAYQAEKKIYMTDEKVNASHILITTKTRSAAEAEALAAELRQRAVAGEDFGNLAKEFSEDPSAAANAGGLGFFKRGQMVKPFEEVVFAMQKPGEISEVVQSPFGYHIILFNERKAPEQIPFDAIKGKIIEELRKQMANKVWQDKLIAIRSASDIVVDDELLHKLRDKYAPEATEEVKSP